jgi:hypothetical protein
VDEFKEQIAHKRKQEKEVQQKFQDSSRDRLNKIATKKIKTTMIGSLSAIEKKLGYLWEDNSPEALAYRELYESIREEILDIGNTQMRNLTEELAQYKVEWQRYNLQLPVAKVNNSKGE